MLIFDPKWLKLHKRICYKYEKFAFAEHLKGNNSSRTMIVSVVGKVLEDELSLSPDIAYIHALDLYESFRKFDIRPDLEITLRKNNPIIPDGEVDEICKEVKKKYFLTAKYEHMSFLFYTISTIIERRNLEINSSEYILKICTNEVPEDKSLLKLMKRTHRFAMMLGSDESR